MSDLHFGRLYKANKEMVTYPEYIYTICMSAKNVMEDENYDRIKIMYMCNYGSQDILSQTMFKYEITQYYQLVEDVNG